MYTYHLHLQLLTCTLELQEDRAGMHPYSLKRTQKRQAHFDSPQFAKKDHTNQVTQYKGNVTKYGRYMLALLDCAAVLKEGTVVIRASCLQ